VHIYQPQIASWDGRQHLVAEPAQSGKAESIAFLARYAARNVNFVLVLVRITGCGVSSLSPSVLIRPARHGSRRRTPRATARRPSHDAGRAEHTEERFALRRHMQTPLAAGLTQSREALDVGIGITHGRIDRGA